MFKEFDLKEFKLFLHITGNSMLQIICTISSACCVVIICISKYKHYKKPVDVRNISYFACTDKGGWYNCSQASMSQLQL